MENENNNNVENITLDGIQTTREAVEEKKRDLDANQRIIETKPGEAHTLTRFAE